AFDVEGVCAGVGYVNVVHGDPEKAWRFLLHKAFCNVNRKLVGTGEGSRVAHEVRDGKAEDAVKLLQFKLAAAELRCIERVLVVVAEQMVEVPGGAGGCSG